jgi:acetamidase/formamidase
MPGGEPTVSTGGGGGGGRVSLPALLLRPRVGVLVVDDTVGVLKEKILNHVNKTFRIKCKFLSFTKTLYYHNLHKCEVQYLLHMRQCL